ncbi:flavoprotein [Yinghuangia soli]|uniref:Flavoprotein n=1 Tax=Yinghuangia soli TaxID=2908204 RepID=A0AA41PYT8_9ACTN|nr:flavoprotein [Yinghuangia soli]MCF2528273.1 flavoprotein [Yinghuangia soli]
MRTRGVLYVVGSAGAPIFGIGGFLAKAKAAGWDTCLLLTPIAADWLSAELPTLAEATGRPVRVADRRPGEPRPFPDPDAVLAAPLTFKSLNKWALGLSDSVAIGTLNAALGARVPTVAAPCFSPDLAAHPQTAKSLDVLRACGVRLAEGPGPDDDSGNAFWAGVLAQLDEL